jgi:general secretion pathway protein I
LFRPRSPKPKGAASDAGFSLIEALAALTVAAIMLGALGTLTHSTVRSAMFSEHRVALIETARKVLTALPPRAALSGDPISGELDGSHWRMVVRPYLDTPAVRGGGAWEPELIELDVRGSDGSHLDFDTVRLRKRGAS